MIEVLKIPSGLRSPMIGVLVWLIRGYQVFISPAMRPSCKYYPSCSQYAIDALKQYGFLRGFVLAGWRLLRCNPLSMGGYDPVERQSLFACRADQASHGEGRERWCVSDGGAAASFTNGSLMRQQASVPAAACSEPACSESEGAGGCGRAGVAGVPQRTFMSRAARC